MSLDISICCAQTGNELLPMNITHNLRKMAYAAGLYDCLWHADGCYARDLLPALRAGLSNLLADPDKFKQYEPENRWGTYQDLCQFTREVITACEDLPDAKVHSYH